MLESMFADVGASEAADFARIFSALPEERIRALRVLDPAHTTSSTAREITRLLTGGVADGVGDQFGEEVPDFVDGQGVQRSDTVGAVGSFARGDGGEDGVGEHGEGGVAVPGIPSANLVLVESDFAFAGLEAFLDTPTDACDADEGGEADRGR